MSQITQDDYIQISNLAHSLKDSLKKELTKSVGKQYKKNLIKKTAKAVKRVLNDSLQPEKFKINVTPLKDSKLCIEIESVETQEE